MNPYNAFSNFFLYRPATIFKAPKLRSHMNRLFESQFYTEKEIDRIQNYKLESIFQFARNYTAYYRDIFRDKKLILNKSNLSSITPITKQTIQLNYHKFLPDIHHSLMTLKTTGGSTGEAVTIPKTREAMAHELAATWRGYSWSGVNIGDRQARFWGVPYLKKNRFEAYLTDFVCNRIRLSAFSFSRERMYQYYRYLNIFKPNYFYGYVSMLQEFAEFLLEYELKLKFKLKAIIPTSEVLTESHRKLFMNAFKAPVFNEYGCGEIGSVAHECENGSLHISNENMIVEILNGEKPCSPGEKGEIVVTELNNYAFPLIRYRLGDYAQISDHKCQCGRTLPVIDKVYGRAYDVVEIPGGKKFHGEFFMYIFEELQRKKLGVIKFQVIQIDYNKFKIKIVPSKNFFKQTEKLVIKRIQDKMGSNIEVTFDYVEQIEREKSGKMRLIVGMNR